MILRKTPEEIKQMRAAGLMLWEAHQEAAGLISPGVSTGELDAAVDSFLASKKATPLFKGVPGRVPYPAATCISVNEQVVHGIPGPRKLQEGDIVGIDIGVRLGGWCADAAVTYAVGRIAPEARRLMDVTESVLRQAIAGLGRHSKWSRVAAEMGETVAAAGFSYAAGLFGHGIGREMWEDPQVPNHWTREMERFADFEIRPGLVICVEPMVNAGGRAVKCLSDHWTVATRDGSLSAHYEHTIAITENGPMVLTAGPDGKAWGIG